VRARHDADVACQYCMVRKFKNIVTKQINQIAMARSGSE